MKGVVKLLSTPQGRMDRIRCFSQSVVSRQGDMSHYPVDDALMGLTEEQSRLRETVFKFCQKELAPHAQRIDKTDEFDRRKEFWTKLGQMGLLGMFMYVY